MLRYVWINITVSLSWSGRPYKKASIIREFGINRTENMQERRLILLSTLLSKLLWTIVRRGTMRIVLHVFLWYSDKLMVKTLRIRKDAWFLNSIVDLIIVFDVFWCVYIFAILHIYISNTLLILYSLIL